MLFRRIPCLLLILVGQISLIKINHVLSQLMPEAYTVKAMHPNSTMAQGAWGMDIDIGEIATQPRYDLTIWSTIGFPAVLTPCSYMYPIVISLKNINYVFETNPISFSCNHAGLTGPIWISTAFGSISVNQTSSYYVACNMVVDYLNAFEPSMIQSTSATNFTFLIPGTLIGEALASIVEEGVPASPSPDPVLTWLQQHYYSESWVNVGSILNLAASFSDMVVLPFKYKVELPPEVLHDSSIEGSSPPDHSYVDLFNMTFSYGRYDSELSSGTWQPKGRFAGFQPPVVNSAQGAFINIQNNVTTNEYNSAVPFGWSNIPLSVSPIRVVMPSNLPSNARQNCVSNYLFYYPMDPYWSPTNNSSSPFNLSLLKDSSQKSFISKYIRNDSTISRNTILSSMYFSKRPFLNGKKYPGQLQNTLSTYLTFSNNFLGGCYYNGTFPYSPESTYTGVHAGVGLCGTHLRDSTTQFKSPFYLPPIKYLSGPSLISYFFVLTSLVQYVNYDHKGTFRSDLYDETRTYKKIYPGNGLLHSLLLATASNQPFIFYTLPSFINHDTSVTLGSEFYQISVRYINRNYGNYAFSGSGMTCRAARFVPMKRDMYSLKAAWQCKTKDNTSSDTWSDMIEVPREEITSCQLNRNFVTCLNTPDSQNQFIGMVNTSPKEHVITLKGSSFKTSSYLAITLTMYTDTMAYTSPNQGISVKLFSPPITGFCSPEYCSKIPMIPITPTTIAQIFLIYPTVKAWDHIHNTKYSFLIPFNKGLQIRNKVTLGKTEGVSINKEFYVTAYLYCESLRKVSGVPSVSKITIAEFSNLSGSMIITTKYPVLQNSKFSNCVHELTISESISPKSTAVSYETLIQSKPSPVANEFKLIEFGAVDFPPAVGKLSVYQPDEKGASMGDSIFLTLSNVAFSNKEQDDGFSSFGIIASSSQIISQNSTVIFLGDSLSQLPPSLRLPATAKEWFVYVRAQTVTFSGCYIPCQPPFRDSFYSHWCSNDLSILNAFSCPFSRIKMKKEDSKSEIEDAIAVVTHPLAYTSLIEAIHMVSALFEQSPENGLIWRTYFDSVYSTALEMQRIPRAYDFASFKLLSLDVLRKVSRVAYENPRLGLDVSRPLEALMNITLNAECTNSPSVSSLVLETLDMLIAGNGWRKILQSRDLESIVWGFILSGDSGRGVHKEVNQSERNGRFGLQIQRDQEAVSGGVGLLPRLSGGVRL
ncbi:putative secrete protein [Cryptosporidium canis]|uniref:Secrete protein n=1 Tax=Cryptosporidium canis TaxID=195482 RepID=A0ABQ8P6L0_9CRYT|nr:putative secrete protein [Cryptosporidium canis]